MLRNSEDDFSGSGRITCYYSDRARWSCCGLGGVSFNL